MAQSSSEVRLTILVPEDSEEPYALWCVFGDHPPFAAFLGDVDEGVEWAIGGIEFGQFFVLKPQLSSPAF